MPDLSPFVISGLCTGAVYVLAGVGLVVLYRASGVLHFAQGALGALGALVAWSMRALANDREMSGLVGVPVLRVDAWAWVISGVLSGVSGIFLANMLKLQAIPLTYLVVPAVAAGFFGRLTSVNAVVVGGLAIGVIEAIATPFPEIAGYRSATPFVFAALVLLWYQRGGLVLSRIDQFRSVPASFEAVGTLWQQLRVGIAAAAIVAVLLPYLASAYWLKTFTGVTIMALCSLSVAGL